MLRIRLFGSFSATLDSSAVEVRSRKSRALVGYLAASGDMSATRAAVCDTLWGSRGHDQARASLRQELAALRRALGEGGVAIGADTERVWIDPRRADVDLARLRDPEAPAADALDVVRGVFLGGLELREPEFEDWLAMTRREIAGQVGLIARSLGGLALAASDWPLLDLAAGHLLDGEPYDEEALRWHMHALAMRGRRGAALEAFDAFAKRLNDDLATGPEAETLALRARLSATRTATAAPADAAPMPEQIALRRPAVLFLPFEALSRSDDDALLASGLCEDIRTTLACWRWFPVIGPEALGGATGDIQSLAAAVKASYAVTGSVRRSGNRARVVARLIEAGTAREIWSQTFDGELADIFDFQDEVSQRIVSQIEPEINSAAAARVSVARPRDMATWELLAKAVDAERHGGDGYGTREANETQKALVREALERDPGSSGARARLARCHFRDFLLQWSDDTAGSLAECLAESARAVEADPGNSFARAVRSQGILFGQSDPAGALEHAQEAVRLNPSNVIGHVMMGCVLVYYGDPQRGFDHYQHVFRLNPNFSNVGAILCDQMMCRALSGDLGDAVNLAHKTMTAAPKYYRGLQRCAAVMAQAGEMTEARDILKRVEAIGGAFSESYVRETYPFVRPQDLDFLITGLRKAGWQG